MDQMKDASTIAQIASSIRYEPETGNFYWIGGRWKDTTRAIGWANPSGHIRIDHNGTKYYAHRLAIALETGAWPVEEVDHINRNPSDNRWCNLRLCSRSENMRNSPKRAHSKQPYKGVRPAKSEGRWQARIRVDGEEIFLGTHESAEKAHQAYVEAAHRLHGEFMRAE